MGRNVILVNNTVLKVVKRADLICFHNNKKRENRNGNDGR